MEDISGLSLSSRQACARIIHEFCVAVRASPPSFASTSGSFCQRLTGCCTWTLTPLSGLTSG
eukprot:9411285-Alexandrium_andersonii.AAC.1